MSGGRKIKYCVYRNFFFLSLTVSRFSFYSFPPLFFEIVCCYTRPRWPSYLRFPQCWDYTYVSKHIQPLSAMFGLNPELYYVYEALLS